MTSKITGSLRVLCDERVTWITREENINRILIPFIINDEYVSKRLIYWTVSKYAQTKNITIIQSKHITNVYEQYSNHLRAYNRRLFDVFCRQPYLIDLDFYTTFDQWCKIHFWLNAIPNECQRVIFECVKGQCVVRTTLGQLNFFFWAWKDGVLAYIKKYESRLMEEMKQDSRRRRETTTEGTKKKHRARQHIKGYRPDNKLILLYRPCSFQV